MALGPISREEGKRRGYNMGDETEDEKSQESQNQWQSTPVQGPWQKEPSPLGEAPQSPVETSSFPPEFFDRIPWAQPPRTRFPPIFGIPRQPNPSLPVVGGRPMPVMDEIRRQPVLGSGGTGVVGDLQSALLERVNAGQPRLQDQRGIANILMRYRNRDPRFQT